MVQNITFSWCCGIYCVAMREWRIFRPSYAPIACRSISWKVATIHKSNHTQQHQHQQRQHCPSGSVLPPIIFPHSIRHGGFFKFFFFFLRRLPR